MTQVYEDALRPFGIRVTQFTVLQALELAGEISQGTLAEILASDSTTLTRNLAIMRRHGWIAERRGSDRRERYLRLTAHGTQQLKRATPAWSKAQAGFSAKLGETHWQQLQKLVHAVATIATEKGEAK